jgi:hypothetical protein
MLVEATVDRLHVSIGYWGIFDVIRAWTPMTPYQATPSPPFKSR